MVDYRMEYELCIWTTVSVIIQPILLCNQQKLIKWNWMPIIWKLMCLFIRENVSLTPWVLNKKANILHTTFSKWIFSQEKGLVL